MKVLQLLRHDAAGLAGGGPIACGPGSISDLFSEHDRALPMSVYTLGALLGMLVNSADGSENVELTE